MKAQKIFENVYEFPSTTYASRSTLPDKAGVYFVFAEDGEITYVGKSQNIKSRWASHHKAPRMKEGNYQIAWFVTGDLSTAESLEGDLIRMIRPKWNKVVPLPPGEMTEFRVRISDESHRKISEAAKQNDRSTNAEYVYRLEESLKIEEQMQYDMIEIKTRLAAIEKILAER